MAEIIIADITAHTGVTTTTLRFATQGFTTGGRNLLTYSEDFSNAIWTKQGCTITAGAAIAPDGIQSASKVENTAGAVSLFSQPVTVPASATADYYATFFVKKGNTSVVTLNAYYVGNAEDNVYFNFDTMGVSGAPHSGEYIFQNAGNGWYRIGFRMTRDATGSRTQILLRLWESSRGSGVAGNYCLAWGGQLEQHAKAGNYIQTLAANVSDFLYYEGRISQPGNVQRAIFNNRNTFGRSQMGYGEIVLVNADGSLDQFLTYGFAGFGITIKRGTIAPNQATPTWTTLLTGVMDSADFTWGEVSIKVRDRQQELDKPLQATRYAGNNALPAGLEGVATDLQGKPKPILYGKALNFAPPCVNTTRQIYQLSDGVIQSVDLVLDRGTTLTAGAAYSSQADMETNAPTAGQYRAWLNAAGSYIRLGSAPAGTVTVDATQGAAASNRTAAQLMNAVLLKAGISSGDITAADVTALDTANSSVCGYWVGHDREATGGEVMDILANSVGAWWGVDRLGKFRMARVADPRQNLFPYSEDFSNADWLKAFSSLTSGQTSPTGDTSAFILTDADAGNAGYLQRTGLTYATGSAIAFSMHVKKDAIGRATRFPCLRASFGTLGADGRAELYFDTATGESSTAATGSTTLISARVQDTGLGWWRVSLVASNSAATTVNPTLFGAHGASASWVSSVATTGAVTVWGAQLEYGEAATLYAKTSGSALAGATSIGTISAVDILKINRVRSTDQGAGIPAWQVKLNHTQYATTQGDLGSSVAATVKSERALKARSVTSNDAAIKTKWPKAVEIEFETYLTSAADAATEAARRLALYKEQRDTLQIRARLDDSIAAAIDLGKVLTVQVPRFNYASGKKMLVTGIRTDLRNNIFDLTLWG